MTMTSPATMRWALTASKQASSDSNTRAGPRWKRRSWPASLTTQPSGASEPRRMAGPPVGWVAAAGHHVGHDGAPGGDGADLVDGEGHACLPADGRQVPPAVRGAAGRR